MAMQMQRAFNSKMLTTVVKYTIATSVYNSDNQIVEGQITASNLKVVNLAGNKFSQFEEGEAIHSEDGGYRFSDFRTIYMTDKYSLEMEDKIGYSGKFYNVLQRSDEKAFGFWSFLIERSEEWTPS
jgi:hypothetical protein